MTDSKAQWSAFEHQIYRFLKVHEIEKKSCLLAISGGADSMALLQVFAKLQSALELQIAVGHCHHGASPNQQHHEYRDAVLKFVENQASLKDFRFFAAKSEKVLPSENEMRDFRQSQFRDWREREEFDFVVWAHHAEDFLETQLLRMIRGSGKHAILAPMKEQSDFNLRPLLKSTKAELIFYLQNQKMEWLEDPSNQDENYLRNWLRLRWLPDLEQKCPGALKSFSRSLDLLLESHNDSFPEEIWTQNGISRPLFLTLNESQKRQVLAIYIRQMQIQDFTQNQIKEIIKQLDNSQLNHTFKSAQLVWSLSKELISAKAPFLVNAN